MFHQIKGMFLKRLKSKHCFLRSFVLVKNKNSSSILESNLEERANASDQFIF